MPLIDSGFLDNGLPYLVYEYVHGHNLRDEIAHSGKIAPQRVRDILLQVTAALQNAHENNAVHRNLKPGNILVLDTESGAPKIRVTGFGIARQVSTTTSASLLALTATKKVVGTPTYMSPEQFATSKIDERSDIYSIGCVAYEMLCGRPPYSAQTFLATAAKHAFTAPKSISELNPDVPPYLEAIVIMCMRKNREERYQSMADVHADLERRECRFGQPKFEDDANVSAKQAESKHFGPVVAFAACAVIAAILCLFAAGR